MGQKSMIQRLRDAPTHALPFSRRQEGRLFPTNSQGRRILSPLSMILPLSLLGGLLGSFPSCHGFLLYQNSVRKTMVDGSSTAEPKTSFRQASALHLSFLDDTVRIDKDHELYWLEKQSGDDYNEGIYGLTDNDDLLFGSDDDEESTSGKSLGQSIGLGELVVCLPEMASSEECLALFEAGLEAASRRQEAGGPAARGRSRFSVSDPTAFSGGIVLTAEEILLRVMDYVDENIPSVYEWLFEPSDQWAQRQPLNAQLEQRETPPESYLQDTCPSLRDLYTMGELEWSEGEPAINIYEGGGYFGAHKDHLALTVLIPLTSPSQDFEGGGTGFWAGNRAVDENPSTDPVLILKPPLGSALLFGGDVTHAGMPVESGYRSVLVCSFSTKTSASSPDRLHGLQAPPKVSANFKGTS